MLNALVSFLHVLLSISFTSLSAPSSPRCLDEIILSPRFPKLLRVTLTPSYAYDSGDFFSQWRILFLGCAKRSLEVYNVCCRSWTNQTLLEHVAIRDTKFCVRYWSLWILVVIEVSWLMILDSSRHSDNKWLSVVAQNEKGGGELLIILHFQLKKFFSCE